MLGLSRTKRYISRILPASERNETNVSWLGHGARLEWKGLEYTATVASPPNAPTVRPIASDAIRRSPASLSRAFLWQVFRPCRLMVDQVVGHRRGGRPAARAAARTPEDVPDLPTVPVVPVHRSARGRPTSAAGPPQAPVSPAATAALSVLHERPRAPGGAARRCRAVVTVPARPQARQCWRAARGGDAVPMAAVVR